MIAQVVSVWRQRSRFREQAYHVESCGVSARRWVIAAVQRVRSPARRGLRRGDQTEKTVHAPRRFKKAPIPASLVQRLVRLLLEITFRVGYVKSRFSQ